MALNAGSYETIDVSQFLAAIGGICGPVNSRPAVAFPAALAMRLSCIFATAVETLLARPRP
jgi:hypothetical protein